MSTHFVCLWSGSNKQKLNNERMVGRTVGTRGVNNNIGAKKVKGKKERKRVCAEKA